MNADEVFGAIIDPALQPILEQFYDGAEDDTILSGLQDDGYTEAQAQRMLREASNIFEAMPASARRRNTGWLHRLGGVFRRLVEQASDILELVRAGEPADASWQCLELAGSALRRAFTWGMAAGLAFVIVGVALELLPEAPTGIRSVLVVIAAALMLPPFAAVLVIFASLLFGMAFGFLGLFQEGHRLRGAAGFALNGLLLALMLAFFFIAYAALG
jgi:hypothetical protein